MSLFGSELQKQSFPQKREQHWLQVTLTGHVLRMSAPTVELYWILTCLVWLTEKNNLWILYCYMGCQASEVWVYMSVSIRIISRNTEMNYSMHFKWKSLGNQQELNSQTQLKFFQGINSDFLLGSWTNHRIKCSRLTHMCSLAFVI